MSHFAAGATIASRMDSRAASTQLGGGRDATTDLVDELLNLPLPGELDPQSLVNFRKRLGRKRPEHS